MKIGQVHTNDAKELTKLAMRSKNHWKYGPLQIAQWKTELTITPEYILQNHVFKLLVDGQLIGFYAYIFIRKREVKLDALFIEPDYICKGYGKRLMNDLLQRIQNAGCEKVLLDADPNAEKFYEKFGFRLIGQRQSSIKNRFLPIMELQLRRS